MIISINNEKHNDLCIGIDLGTTNSVIAVVNVKANGDLVSKVVEIPRYVDVYSTSMGKSKFSTAKKVLLPSCIYYREEDKYAPLVGDFAKTQFSVRPQFVAKSIKSQMGNKNVEGLSPDIQDKTPAQVASNILKHLISNTEKIYKSTINDAVITVPANFDSAMCKATLDAAELAGIKVKNDDGTERAVLLSEPNAVIYDLINQVRNGEIPRDIIDLSEMKNVMVFDLGGGTLDVTMHQIVKRRDYNDVLKVTEIATNRYTLLGGDDFDQLIADEMYKRYISQYSAHASIVSKLKKDKKAIMPLLLHYAELLKMELSDRNSGVNVSDGWEDEDDDQWMVTGGAMSGIGYAYDDSFRKEDVEKILEPFMGLDLSFNDYKNIDKLESGGNTRNIIYPILDVLKKAADKLGTDDVHVDAVIVNGGMSKFYMITDRLKSFFGLDPIVALDPDQSVARGAAIYHYYIHKYAHIDEEPEETRVENHPDINGDKIPCTSGAGGMEINDDENRERPEIRIDTSGSRTKPVREIEYEKAEVSNIQFGRSILNDSLYLGMRNGSVHILIPTGAELPYDSEMQFGFKLMPGQNTAEIPIKSRNIGGGYRTIATGKIKFEHVYSQGVYISFMVHMNSSKVITMKAWTSSDAEGHKVIEECTTEIVVGENEHHGKSSAKKILAQQGTILNASNEVNNLKQLCIQLGKEKNAAKKSNLLSRIDTSVKVINGAGNPQDFGESVINAMTVSKDYNLIGRLLGIATKMSPYWDDSHRRKLSKICMEQLAGELSGVKGNDFKKHINVQALYALGICGSDEQLKKISKLNDDKNYYEVCLSVHGRTGTDREWIMDKLRQDLSKVQSNGTSSIALSACAAAMSLRKDRPSGITDGSDVNAAKLMCRAIKSGNLSIEELSDIILYLGVICDQRHASFDIVDREVAGTAKEVINEIETIYDETYVKACCSHMMIAEKLLDGEKLLCEEEERIQKKLDK